MKPTIENSTALQTAFDFFNEHCFDGDLKSAMVTFSRNKNVLKGYFSPDRWTNDDGTKIHEIAINANVMNIGISELLATLVHEMCHQWRWDDFEKKPRMGYHDMEWATKMKECGLQPFGPDGREVGQTVSHEIIKDGKFEELLMDYPEEAIFPWRAEELNTNEGSDEGESSGEKSVKAPKSGKRAKYVCPACGMKLWGKSGLNVVCGEDGQILIPSEE